MTARETEMLDPKALEAALRALGQAYVGGVAPPSIASYERELAEVAITAYLAARGQAEGWRLVPVEATAENGMKAALIGDLRVNHQHDLQLYDPAVDASVLTWTAVKRLYRAMISAAPPAPEPGHE